MTAVRRIAILGAESTGKSTLAAALAAHYHSVWVPEYLRQFVDSHARVPCESEQVGIARAQRAHEDAAAAQAHRWLFCDTTALMTAVYSGVYWGRVEAPLAALAALGQGGGGGVDGYALTLVAAPDLPWQADGLQRESAAMRERVHAALIAELERRAIAYRLLTGPLAARLAQAHGMLERLGD